MTVKNLFSSIAVRGLTFTLVFTGLLDPITAKAQGRPGNHSDSALLELVERQTFQYFWTGAEPNSGMGAERIHMDNIYPDRDQSIIATGGSGFGLMAILAAIHRDFITRKQGFERIQKIVSFLEKADRFHGAWPHWLNDTTGHVKPFGREDDGGDLVETSYLLQGLLCARQFFKDGNDKEKSLASRIDTLWRGVDFDWYRNGGQNVLFWHWSPDYGWKKNFQVHGYNEWLLHRPNIRYPQRFITRAGHKTGTSIRSAPIRMTPCTCICKAIRRTADP